MLDLLALPIFSLLVILQSTIISRLQVVNGSADLVLLVIVAWSLQERVKRAWVWTIIGAGMVSFVSAVPLLATFTGYLLAMGLARLLHRRIWQAPILAMFITTTVSSVLQHLVALVFLNLSGSPISIPQAFVLVTVPSAFLNLILALPVYALVTDFANLVYPVEDEK
ncbi:MAG: hypothetical protein HPY59_12380 [Anaerolineae bacterium]|nr:hypothetical protein [Anaerolineae bacterium]